MKVDLKSLSLEELQEFMKTLGEPGFRAKQIFSWLYKGAESFDEMTDISKGLREKLGSSSFISCPKIEKKLVSAADGTVKYLYRMPDGQAVETVVMSYRHGNTACLSTEAGCAMGCSFCASGIGGLARRLTAGEIADQVIFSQKDLGIRIDNIVLMGTGEPLDNFENVVKFLYNVNDKNGLGIGMRHISLSTCGIAPMIDRLAELKLQLTLSVSLHAADDETRSRLMPINKKYPLGQLIPACKRYFDKTGRRISFEYAVISGLNDKEEDALKLSSLLSGLGPVHVNLIPVNPVEEKNFKRPDKKRVEEFEKALARGGLTATVRRKLGEDIDAACGQLRRHSQGAH